MSSDNNKMNVLYIIWSLGLGGAERVVINLAKGIDRAKFNPIVSCLNDKGKFAGELETDGIKVIALNKKGKFDPSIINKFVRLIKENNIHIVHTHLWGANFWGRIAAKKANVPIIIATEHNTDTWKNWFYFMLDRWLSRHTHRIIAISNSVREFYVSKGISEDKIEVIYNGVDTENLQIEEMAHLEGKESLGIMYGESILGVIGRLVPQKGHRYFLLALKELLNSYRVKGLIVGSGPIEQELKEFSQNIGLDRDVIFTGLRQDIPSILKNIDVLVIPSLREGLPMVALEAMAQGVPIVATKVGGIPELIIDGKTGILVEPNNHLQLKEAISRVIEDKDLSEQLMNNARKRIEEDFSLKNMLTKTQELYERLWSDCVIGCGKK